VWNNYTDETCNFSLIILWSYPGIPAVRVIRSSTGCHVAFVGKKYMDTVQDWSVVEGTLDKLNRGYKYGWAELALEAKRAR
jgi:hypothetical protein